MNAEPRRDAFSNRFLRYFAATRPAFLSVTLVGCLIGLGTAFWSGIAIDPVKACLTIFFALVAHAGANVVNDYHDALSGADEANQDRLFPFTGGSRFIQNGVLTVREAGVLGYSLLASIIPAGLWLAWHSASGLIFIGLAGILIGWAYSAPPLKLMARGVGELAIIAGWLLITVGTDFVQRGEFASPPIIAGLPFALLVAAILFINQFPDRASDERTGKHTLVVRMGTYSARWIYGLIIIPAYALHLFAIFNGLLPYQTLFAMFTLGLSLTAWFNLLANADHAAKLRPAIEHTIAAANLHGLIIAAGLLAGAYE